MTAETDATEQDRLILDSVGRFLEREVKPHVHALEHDDVYPEDIVEGMKALGLFGATIGTDYGGLGLSATTYAKIVETVSTVWMSLSGIFNSHLIMAAAVERFGTAQQKQSFLPRFATGELRGGLALTEPDCGTDLQAIRTTALKDGNGHRINGAKTFSNGQIADPTTGAIAKILSDRYRVADRLRALYIRSDRLCCLDSRAGNGGFRRSRRHIERV